MNYKDNDIITILPEEDYILYIGHQHRETRINFKFDIRSIIYKLNKEAHDTNCEVVNFKLYFQNIYFTKDLVLENITFNNEVYFENCTFNGNVSFTNSIFKENFKFASNTISKKVIFSNIEIFKKAYFLETKEIKNDNYLNVNENGEIEVIKVIENKKLQIVFDNLVFKDNDSTLYIDNGNYKKSFKVSFQNINIKGKIELRNMEIEEADFKGSIIDGGLINPVNFKVNKFANRESALFLKQQAYARNNVIDALEYKAKEIECHKDDLMKSAKDIIQNKEYSFTKKTKELYKIVGDIASIYLSSLYSDNGQNWLKALAMTIFITAFCFTVFYIYIPDFYKTNIMNLSCNYKNLFPELIKYFIPTDYTLLIKYAASSLNLLLKIFGVLVYFLGKVLFWYGSVQTVTAFRKFSKGA